MSTLSIDQLRDWRQRYQLTTFVETGCFEGDGIAAALAAGFERLHSCDIDENRVRQCHARFADVENVQISQGDSLSFLAEQLTQPFGPALFWLDAHYPGFYGLTDRESLATRFPLPAELALIHRLRDGATRDVVAADDMRVIASADNPRWRPSEVGDYYRVDDLSITQLTSLFGPTHSIEIDQGQEGILVLKPRGVRIS